MLIRYVIFLICLFACLGCNKSTDKSFNINLYPRDFTNVLSVRGEIFSQNEISMSVPSGVGGSIKSIPESGTPVKAGDVLVEIESKNQKKRLQEKQRRLKYVERRIIREKRKIAQEKLQNDLKILEKNYSLNVKKLEAEYQLGEKDPRVIKSLDLKIRLLEEKIQLQISKLDSYEILAQTKSISEEQIELLKKNLRTAKINRDLEKLEKRSILEGTVGLKKEKLQLEIAMLEQDLAKVISEKTQKEKSYPLRLEKLQLEKKKRERQIEKAIDNQQKSSIKANSDGVFMRVTRWGGRQVKKGVDVWRGTMVGKIIDHSMLEARIRLPERYVDSVQIGDRVVIHSLQKNNKKLIGKIIRIESVASLMNPRNRKSIKYHWAYLDATSKALSSFQPGETLIANIQLATYKDCWIIPKELATVNMGSLILNTNKGKHSFNEFSTSEDYFIVKAHNHKDTIGETLTVIPNF